MQYLLNQIIVISKNFLIEQIRKHLPLLEAGN